MTVRTFDLVNLDPKRLTMNRDGGVNLRVDHNSTVTPITEKGATSAQLDFRSTATYRGESAVVGVIGIDGQIAWEGDAKALVKYWSAGGQMSQEVAQEIHTVIMTSRIPEAVLLERDQRPPPPIPIPAVQVPGPVPPPKRGRSPRLPDHLMWSRLNEPMDKPDFV